MPRSSFDLVVLGSGSAGTGAALSARRAGAKRVAVVERDKIGGDCPNYACVPTKALLFSASRFRIVRESARFGVRASAEFDWTAAMRRRNEIVQQIIEHDERLYADAGIDLVCGDAHFVDELRLEADGRTLRAERVIIATGSEPIVPDVHERIWAAGDVAGHFQYTHVAAYEGGLAGHNAFAARPVAIDLDGIPRITFADPPLAGVGSGEAEARKRGLDPIVARASLEGQAARSSKVGATGSWRSSPTAERAVCSAPPCGDRSPTR